MGWNEYYILGLGLVRFVPIGLLHKGYLGTIWFGLVHFTSLYKG
jgi:hypothetical protein